jgi:hypothetical protein
MQLLREMQLRKPVAVSGATKHTAMIRYIMADVKIIDESYKISDKRGNGKLRREVWVDEVTKKITRYNLAYINHAIHPGDNGRVLGYDNAHDGHHRHYFGVVEPVEFVSFEDTEARFEQDWIALKDST